MRLNINHLATLRDLARLGTLAKVAEAAHYTPGAVSQQIDAIEKAIGAPVIVKVGRRVALTDVGQVLADHADAVLVAEERARAAAEQVAGRPSAPLVLGIWGSTAAALLLPVLRRMSVAHPAVVVRSREVDVNTAATSVRERDVDVAFGLDYPGWPMPRDKDIEIVPLHRERFAIAAPVHTDLIDPALTRVRLADLAGAPWILPGRDTAMGRAMLIAFRAAGVEPDPAHEINDTAGSLRLVEQGLGLAPVTDLMLALVSGAAVRRVELVDVVERRVVLLAPRKRAGRAGIDALLDSALAALADVTTSE